MKKIALILIFILPVVFLYAQDITTNWPYIYSNFTQGKVYYSGGETHEAPMNIHLLKSKLHYVDGNNIKEAQNVDILLVEIGKDKYYSYNGQMIKVLSGNQNSFLGELNLADFSKLDDTGGAYGTSANSQSTKQLSSVEIGRYGNYGSINTNHIDMLNNKDGGKLLHVSKEYYIVADGKIYPATKKGIETELVSDDKEAFNAFVKQNKIKWKDADSLAKLLGFLRGNNISN